MAQGEKKDSFVVHHACMPEPEQGAEILDPDSQSLDTDCSHLLSVVMDKIIEAEPSLLPDKLPERSQNLSEEKNLFCLMYSNVIVYQPCIAGSGYKHCASSHCSLFWNLCMIS